MSKAAAQNRDRPRRLREIDVPHDLRLLLEPDTRAFVMSGCRILVSKQKVGWHLSISHPKRLPTWEEVREARYLLIPDEAVMVMLLPPREEYVNVHEFCFQLYEIPREYIDQEQDRL